MLSRLSLHGFRACGDTTTLEFAPLTVLAGANNTGKSSFIGALLALVQSQQVSSRHRLLLSGEWVDLGPFDEALSPDHEAFSFALEGRGVDGRELSVVWDFVEEPERRSRPEARVLRIEAAVGDEDPITISIDEDGGIRGTTEQQLQHPAGVLRLGAPDLVLYPFGADQVLAVGPYRAPPVRLSPFRSRLDGSLVGQFGQYAAEAFYERQGDMTDLLPPGVAGPQPISHAMNAWWSYVLEDEIIVVVQEEARHGYSVRLDTGGIANRSLGQVGFGLSQLWPILVAGLASRPGDLVIIETPEAHLHPGAQHRLAALFVALATHGRQVIVETHSEHVVNAACLAVKDKRLPTPDQFALSFFTQIDGRTRIQRIDVDTSGRRLAAPPGFFDQAAEELLGLLDPS